MQNEESGRRAFLFIHHSAFCILHFFLAMQHFDLFDLFRYALGWIVTIYATVITWQSMQGWYVWLAGTDKHISLLRRYLITHGLRLRFKTFWGDVLISILLCVVFLMLWRAHRLVYDLGDKKQAIAEARVATDEWYVKRTHPTH
jgi:hypothetical protein